MHLVVFPSFSQGFVWLSVWFPTYPLSEKESTSIGKNAPEMSKVYSFSKGAKQFGTKHRGQFTTYM